MQARAKVNKDRLGNQSPVKAASFSAKKASTAAISLGFAVGIFIEDGRLSPDIARVC